MKLKPSFYNHWADLENGKTVLFNFFSGNLCEVPKEDIVVYKNVLENCNRNIPDDFVSSIREDLTKGQYLIPADTDELQMIRIRNLSQRYDGLFYNLVIMPTLECNFTCKYCFETKYPGLMGEDIQNGIINWAKKIAQLSRRLHITWYGGEPLLDFSLVERVNSRIKEICLKTGCFFYSDMTTNGYLFTEEIFSKVDDLALKSFQITIDGSPEFHNKYRHLKAGGETFDVILNNVFRLLERTKAQVIIRVNVDQENYHSLPQLLKRIPEKYRTPRLTLVFKDIFSDPGGQLGIEAEIDRQRISNYQMMRNLYIKTMQEGFGVFIPALSIKDHHCDSGSKNYFIVHPSGDLYRCTVEFETGQPVGRLKQDGSLTIDSNGMAKWLAYIPGDDEKCANCKFLPMCQGGCRYNRILGKNPCSLESTDLDGIIELYYLSKTRLSG